MIMKLILLLLLGAFANANPSLGRQKGRRLTALNSRSSHVHHKGSDANIVGGQEVDPPHSFPFQVYLETGLRSCGGALISDQWVLTSGDCVMGAVSPQDGGVGTIKVVMGAHNITNTKESTQISMNATEFHVPDTYLLLVDDIGLIHLPKKVTFDENINATKLPTAPLEDDAKCNATGWGLVEEKGYEYSDVLMVAELQVVPISNCEGVYGDVEKNTICIDPFNKGAFCDGDFGGPLHKDGEVHGVAIFYDSKGCQNYGYEGYTAVYPHLSWIEEITGITP